VGVSLVFPAMAFVPDQPPDAVHESALVTLQLRVIPWPDTERVLGVAVMVMTGG